MEFKHSSGFGLNLKVVDKSHRKGIALVGITGNQVSPTLITREL